MEKKVKKPPDTKLKGLFSNGKRNHLPGPAFGSQCVSSRKLHSFPFSGIFLLQACPLRFAGQPADRFLMGSPTVVAMKDRVARSPLINLVVGTLSLAGLIL